MTRFGRRRLLRGAGAAVLLPLLDLDRVARADERRPPKFILFYTPDGLGARFRPLGDPAGSVLDGLAAHASRLSVVRGFSNAVVIGSGAPAAHAGATAGFATAAPPRRSEGDDLFVGVSVDQAIAALGACGTPLPSLVLGTDPPDASSFFPGWSAQYTSHVSWSGPTRAVPKLLDPARVFDAVFGADADPARAAARRKRRSSVLDALGDEARALSARVGAADRARLDEYLEGVRALECRVQSERREPPEGVVRPEAPATLESRTDLLLELAVAALRVDATHVVSFMFGYSGSGETYSFLDVNESHHALLHGPQTAEAKEKHETIATWKVARLARLLDLLAAPVDGRALLDDTVVLFGNEFSDATLHAVTDLPVLLAGDAGGRLAVGRTIEGRGRPLGDLHLTLLQAFGGQATRFGAAGRDVVGALSPG